MNNQISFLEVLMETNGDQFDVSVVHKKIVIEVLTNYLIHISLSYRVGPVKTLLHHAIVINSRWFFFMRRLKKKVFGKHFSTSEFYW